MSLFQKSIAAAALTMAFVPAALGQATLNADGFKEKPLCDKPEIIKEMMVDEKRFPSGIKLTTPRFNTELFIKIKSDGQPNNSAWSLIGDDRKGKLCILESSSVTPYKDTKWYARYFAPDQFALK